LEGSMSQNLQLFNFKDQPVRVVIIDGEIWWIAADVCQILELANSRQVVSALDDDEKGVHTVDTPGGKQKMTCVNESGLYRLIFKSRKSEAKAFQKWVFSEILPSIRKTGSYSVNQSQQPSAIPFNKDVQQRCIANEKLLPQGYWCVVNEMYKEALIVIPFQKELKDWSLPDGSCGKLWRNHCKTEGINISQSVQIPLWVPNLKKPTDVWIYPYILLDTFRAWLRLEYASYYETSYSPSRLIGTEQIESPKKRRWLR
jgi:prophage antirepressor-like protein